MCIQNTSYLNVSYWREAVVDILAQSQQPLWKESQREQEMNEMLQKTISAFTHTNSSTDG